MTILTMPRKDANATAYPQPSVEPGLLKSAMRHVSGQVSVITAGQGAERTGATVTSATALSVDPPTVIVNINRTSSSYPVIRKYGHFGLNILASHDEPVANRFAGVGGLKGEARYDGSNWLVGPSGASLLVGALAAIDCEVEEIIDRHSHGIIIGRVISIQLGEGNPLAYQNGRYGNFTPILG
ncbi:flavin reductase [Agrobacterium vitis]|uniref:Flavin reductase n=1 Tax=Agrobacterium vitis TaxID=373 RepID=A0ABD6G8L1_AGRVI|nr:flavin reductase family protein [Agrobacterium vitis]MUO78720.1 flavin reductase [Agrobacterium vitis]MUO95077.1 flavin reductase [Agrobacterium vitis]MUP05132.1 flavin reductase [Agrobacterium vitis]MUZ81878.1 flavin reductase [Agrobacterium vitis]MVA09610.1 flavin reductase [Agrobacterium vitis]